MLRKVNTIILFPFIGAIITLIFLLFGFKYSVGIIFLPMYIYWIIKKPKVTIAFLLFVMVNLNYFSVPYPFNNLDVLVSSIFIVFSLVYLLLRKQVKFPKCLLFLSFYVFLTIISAIQSPIPLESLIYSIRLLFYLMLIIYLYNLKLSDKDILLFLKMSIYSLILPVIVSFFQLMTGTGVKMLEDVGGNFTRVSGLTSHPNFLGFYLVGIILLIFIFNTEKIYIFKKAWIIYVFLICGIITLLFTFCRGAITGLILGVIIYLIIKKSKMIILTPFIFIILLSIPGVGDRYIELFDINTLLTNSSFYWRMLQWTDLLNLMTPDRYLLGYGAKSSLYFTSYAAHNEYIAFIFEFGILGLGIFLFFIIALFRRILIMKKNNYYFTKIQKEFTEFYFIFLIISLIMAFNDNYFSVPSSITYFWCYTGIFLSISKLRIRKDEIIE